MESKNQEQLSNDLAEIEKNLESTSLSLNKDEIEQVFAKAEDMQKQKEDREKKVNEILTIRNGLKKKEEDFAKKIKEIKKQFEKEKKAFETYKSKALERAKELNEELSKL